MKRILFLFSIFISLSVFAQDNQEDCNNTSKIIKNDIRSDKSAVVIWEEDFGGGFPSGWSSYTNNTGAGNTGSHCNRNANGNTLQSVRGVIGIQTKDSPLHRL